MTPSRAAARVARVRFISLLLTGLPPYKLRWLKKSRQTTGMTGMVDLDKGRNFAPAVTRREQTQKSLD